MDATEPEEVGTIRLIYATVAAVVGCVIFLLMRRSGDRGAGSVGDEVSTPPRRDSPSSSSDPCPPSSSGPPGKATGKKGGKGGQRALRAFETPSVLRGFGSEVTCLAVTPTGDMACAGGACRTLIVAFRGKGSGGGKKGDGSRGALPFTAGAGARGFRVPGTPQDHPCACAWDASPLGAARSNGERPVRAAGGETRLAVAFHRTSEVVVFAVGFDLGTERFDVKKQRVVATGHPDGAIGTLSLHPARLFTAGSGTSDLTVRLWGGAPGGDPTCAVDTHAGELHDVAASPSGQVLAAAGFTSDVALFTPAADDGGSKGGPGLKRAGSLRGASAGAAACAFAAQRIAAACARDGSWRAWTIPAAHAAAVDPSCFARADGRGCPGVAIDARMAAGQKKKQSDGPDRPDWKSAVLGAWAGGEDDPRGGSAATPDGDAAVDVVVADEDTVRVHRAAPCSSRDATLDPTWEAAGSAAAAWGVRWIPASNSIFVAERGAREVRVWDVGVE